MVTARPVTLASRASGARSRGYTLVALVIAITVLMIVIAAVLPLDSTEVQREREEELIFRGRQYAEAIRCFRRKYGRFPTTLKEMIDTRPRTLRKRWKDPITNSRDWGLVTLGSLTPIGPQPGHPGAPGGPADSGGFGGKSPTPVPSPTPDPFGSSGFGGSTGGHGKDPGEGGPLEGAPLLPVMGVYSKSTKKAFRVWQGRDTYDSWKFTEATLASGAYNGPETPGGLPGPGIGGHK